ncbi:MAG: N-acetyltransferase family protein [Phycisphaeraceae bacterium]
MTWNIRDATARDMPAVLDIYNASIPSRLATTDLEPVTLQQRLLSFQHHSPDRRPFWVAEVEGGSRHGAIAGYCSIRDFYGRPAYHATVEIAIYLHPDHQGQGLGPVMLQHALDQCPRLHIRTVLALVFTHNQPSVRLFERFGFERWGTLPNVAELDERWVDVAILGWQREA